MFDTQLDEIAQSIKAYLREVDGWVAIRRSDREPSSPLELLNAVAEAFGETGWVLDLSQDGLIESQMGRFEFGSLVLLSFDCDSE